MNETEKIEVKNEAGELLDVVLHRHPEGATVERREDCLVILGHGVTGDKDRPLLVKLAQALSLRGWPCVRMSFAGNGKSEGLFEEATISKEVGDLSKVIDQLAWGKNLAYIGHSMGGAVGALMAARDEQVKVLVSLAGMVETEAFLEAEFGEVTPGAGLMWDEAGCPLSVAYAEDLRAIGTTLDAVGEITAPWLLFHGLKDDVVLPKDSRALKARYQGPCELVEMAEAEHSFEGHEAELAERVDAWFTKYLK